MKVLQINTVYPNGSTGKITAGIDNFCKKENYSSVVAYRYQENIKIPNSITVSSWFDCHIHNRLAKWTLMQGCFSIWRTKRFLKKVKQYAPNLIQIHNIHGNYINHRLLFNYIKTHDIPVVWTLHDCWSFTGQCPHFTVANCKKWRTGCHHCPQYRCYPASYVDRTKTMWKLKKKWFTGVSDMTLVTPSQWLADLVKESYLQDYPVRVILNGIDLNTFRPTESTFREKYGLQDKHIVLGVAFGWGTRKGLDVFINLAKRIDDRYRIVLVGTDDKVDKQLPPNIISIHRTQNQQELAEIYTAADVFANPTREETLGLVNVEALACGTPVITFRTGGSPECIDETCGSVVDVDDIDALQAEIERVCTQKPYTQEACLERAKAFDMNDRFQEYIDLYKEIYDRTATM